MSKTEAQIVTRIQYMLSDTSTASYSTAEIHLAMYDALFTMAEYAPNIVLGTVTTISGTAEVDVSGQTNLLYGTDNRRSFQYVEFSVDKEPRKYRNFSVTNSRLVMDIDFAPSAGEDVRLYMKKPHGLDGGTSTLSEQLEDVIVNMVAGNVAANHAIGAINKSNITGNKTYIDFMTWGERKSTKALRDLQRMRKAQIATQYPREV